MIMPGTGESCSRRALWKDPALLDRLIRTHSDSLVRFAYSFVCDSAAAEDIVSDKAEAKRISACGFDEDAIDEALKRLDSMVGLNKVKSASAAICNMYSGKILQI